MMAGGRGCDAQTEEADIQAAGFTTGGDATEVLYRQSGSYRAPTVAAPDRARAGHPARFAGHQSTAARCPPRMWACGSRGHADPFATGPLLITVGPPHGSPLLMALPGIRPACAVRAVSSTGTLPRTQFGWGR
jgi:hypothetical protein